jgi:hypothetical protein
MQRIKMAKEEAQYRLTPKGFMYLYDTWSETKRRKEFERIITDYLKVAGELEGIKELLKKEGIKISKVKK